MKANTSVSLWENEEKRGNWHNPHPNQRAGSFLVFQELYPRTSIESTTRAQHWQPFFTTLFTSEDQTMRVQDLDDFWIAIMHLFTPF